MELVLKIPENKPPFIGVLYDGNVFRASTDNKDFVEGHKLGFSKAKFNLMIEPYSKYVDLRLSCDSPISIRFYRELVYDPVKLEKWYRQVRFSKTFNFGHVILQRDKHVLVKTTPHLYNFVLPLDSISLRMEERVIYT